MERLTAKERNWSGTGISKKPLTEATCLTEYASKIITKLADFEDAEEDGRLIRLQCGLRDVVYVISEFPGNLIDSAVLKRIELGKFTRGNKRYIIIPEWSHFASCYYDDDFGKTIFLTREAAERALQSMKGE